LAGKKLRFIYCVELIWALSVPAAWAQTVSPSPTFTSTTIATMVELSPTSTATATVVELSPTFTATPTSTSTNIPFATFIPTSTKTFTPTGTPPTATFTPTNTPGITRASLALMPTAYSNAWNRWDGFNWDIGFSYFIGSIFSRDFAKPDIDGLEKASIALLTSDLKYAWLDDDGDGPGFANGFLLSFLAQVGSGNSNSASGSQSFQVAGNVMGGIYGVMSKTIAKDTAVHLGYIYGLRDFDQSLGLGFFTMNYSQLMPLLNSKLQPVQSQTPAHVLYAGFNTRLLDRDWKFEVLKPFPMAENPILLNARVDGLPLSFNLSYEKWDHGYAVLGYVNFKVTILPQMPAY
jgi:hypothetical protein